MRQHEAPGIDADAGQHLGCLLVVCRYHRTSQTSQATVNSRYIDTNGTAEYPFTNSFSTVERS